MKIIIDTSVWSLALRRSSNNFIREREELIQLIDQSRVIMLGPIRQEILSGIKSVKQFNQLKIQLSSFPDFSLSASEFETAAQFFNKCRSKGIQGSNTDFLICAAAVNYNFSIFTTDKDFTLYKKYIPIKLHIF